MTSSRPPQAGPLRLPPLDVVTARRDDDRLVVARRPSVPLIQVRALLPGDGGAAARLAAAVLLRRRGALERLGAAGATAQAAARPDGLLLSACAEPGDAPRLVALLLELLRPTGEPPAAIVTSEAARLTSSDAVAARDPAESTRRAALRAAFGAASPYAESLAEDLTGTTPADVLRWHARAGAAVVVVCGDIDIRADWGEPDEAPVRPTPFPVAAADDVCPVPRWSVQDRPGSAQTTLRAVSSFPPPGAARRAAAEVVHRLLGGDGKGSRLVRELREKRGYGYHPGTKVVDLAHASYLLLEVDVAAEVTADAVRVVDDVLASMADDPPHDGELERGRRGVIGDLARTLDAQGSLADLLLAQAIAGGSIPPLTRLADQVAETDVEVVRDAAEHLVTGLHGAATADVGALEDQPLPATWSWRS